MNRPAAIAPIVLALALVFTSVGAKGPLTKILITGQELQSPVEIVDPVLLDRFTIWSGPGVGGWDMLNTIPKPDDAKFIIDWTQGIVSAPPSDSTSYSVTMFIGSRKPPRNTYEVLYSIDSAKGGYVYLPSYRKDGFGQWNTFQIYRRVEGRWFRPTRDWEDVVRPLLNEQ